ncbi:hypothetical protein D8B25_02525 [Verminephrobacter aporrectodeae subsp. tuberculatae]|nr:hypothetical protein [Verminephrobacter aporrectodeae subsp. tuberculatae]MCW8201979.1 hypothetical protein [Verminephrobacter aporrectodeae subsp. tuberculatae]
MVSICKLLIYMGFHDLCITECVRGYTKKDSTYVQPHHATNRDNTKSNNYSHKGNVNPYTGKEGTRND